MLTLLDYSSDNSVNSASFGLKDPAIATEFWNCTGGGTGCMQNGEPQLANPDPAFPGADEWAGNANQGEKSLTTLSHRKLTYAQSSTLKPTEQVVMNRFDYEVTAGDDYEQPTVITSLNYDLDDRVTRKQDPDGSIQRLLYDSKDRATKVFMGSNDTSPEWLPRVGSESSCASDDMLLVEQHLYNDGAACREFNELPAEAEGNANYDACNAGLPGNDNFPNNAAMLVRTRHYTGLAEACVPSASVLDEFTQATSRDVRYAYDWRGRPVIVREVAVGYQDGAGIRTFDNPKFIATTTTVFDNLDRPTVVATWDKDDEPNVTQLEDWADGAQTSTVLAMLALAPLTLSESMYDERGRVYEQRTYNVDDASGQTYTFTRTYRDDLNRVVGDLGPQGFTKYIYDPLGGEIANVPAVILTNAGHNRITQALRKLLPYGEPHTERAVKAAYQRVYKNYPEWLKSIEGYLP